MLQPLHRLAGNYICLSRPAGLDTPNITIPNAAAGATATAWPTVIPVTSQLPIAPGTLTGCTNYTNYQDATVYDNLYQPQVQLYSGVANQCYYVASTNSILLSDFLSWNPSLNTDPIKLHTGPGAQLLRRFRQQQ